MASNSICNGIFVGGYSLTHGLTHRLHNVAPAAPESSGRLPKMWKEGSEEAMSTIFC